MKIKEVDNMQEINNTQYFEVPKQEMEVKDILASVYTSLTEKGYNPVKIGRASCRERVFYSV